MVMMVMKMMILMNAMPTTGNDDQEMAIDDVNNDK